MKQETYGRFTPSVLDLIKKTKLTEEDRDKLRLVIESKIKTIIAYEANSIVYDIARDTNK